MQGSHGSRNYQRQNNQQGNQNEGDGQKKRNGKNEASSGNK